MSWGLLVGRLDAHYRNLDQDRYLLERAMEVSSQELRELHQQAHDERARLDAVLQSLPQAVLAIDAQGAIVIANRKAAELLGAGESAVGAHVTDCIQLPAQVVDALEAGEPVNLDDGWAGPPDGHVFPAAIHLIPVEGARTSAVLTINDLTQVKRQERELRRALVEAEVSQRTEQARGRFLANVSHELRTPLNVIIGYAELLLDDAAQPEVADDLGRIRGAAQHLLGLINDILDLSKIDAGKMEVLLEEVDGDLLVHEVADAMRPVVQASESRLEVHLPCSLGRVRTDPVKVRQCLFNLVGNAARFTERGVIRLEGTRDGARFRLSVADTGIGIEPDRLASLFEPFEQAKPDTSRRYGGTGLGLALVQAYTSLLGGEVEVVSEPGVGSTFTLVLPG